MTDKLPDYCPEDCDVEHGHVFRLQWPEPAQTPAESVADATSSELPTMSPDTSKEDWESLLANVEQLRGDTTTDVTDAFRQITKIRDGVDYALDQHSAQLVELDRRVRMLEARQPPRWTRWADVALLLITVAVLISMLAGCSAVQDDPMPSGAQSATVIGKHYDPPEIKRSEVCTTDKKTKKRTCAPTTTIAERPEWELELSDGREIDVNRETYDAVVVGQPWVD